jgi:hypothetical protein
VGGIVHLGGTVVKYVIWGQYRLDDPEEIDSAETKEDADYLRKEYKLAFGSEWRIYVKTRKSPETE